MDDPLFSVNLRNVSGLINLSLDKASHHFYNPETVGQYGFIFQEKKFVSGQAQSFYKEQEHLHDFTPISNEPEMNFQKDTILRFGEKIRYIQKKQ